MCDKSNQVIHFDETKLTRSTRRERHRIDDKMDLNVKSVNNTKDNTTVGTLNFQKT